MAGFLLVLGAILQSFAICLFVLAGWFSDKETLTIIVDLTVWVAMTGAAVLGVSVAEFFSRATKK